MAPSVFASSYNKRRSGGPAKPPPVEIQASKCRMRQLLKERLETLRSLRTPLLTLFQPLSEILREPRVFFKPFEGALEIVFNAAKVDRLVIDDDVGSP